MGEGLECKDVAFLKRLAEKQKGGSDLYSIEEQKLIDKVITEHRKIMSKTGYGKILIHYQKVNNKQTMNIDGQLYTTSKIVFE